MTKPDLWDWFPVTLSSEVDAERIYFEWPYLMIPIVEMVGPQLTYAVGLQALGYPPTWVDLTSERDAVSSALSMFLTKD